MSRRCRVCHKPFRPDFGQQRWCKPCVRIAMTDPKEEPMSTAPELVPPAEIEIVRPAITLFGTNDPRHALERMTDLARVLVDVVRDRKLYVRISGREHLTCEAWTTLGGMLGVVPVVEWSRPLDQGWEARVEVRLLDGRVVGAAESMCSRSEKTWRDRDEYALRSMAQTRAISRALRAPLGQIVVLAGYEPAAAEEVAEETPIPPPPPAPPPPLKPTGQQAEQIGNLITELKAIQPDVDWAERAREIAGVRTAMELTREAAALVISELGQALQEELARVQDGLR